jgi:3-phenylpropionate/trans-cinnamate dioxygenase ferredoxin reductase subunit
MPQYKYLIIGGGMTGDAAVQGIRELDADGSIGLVGAEPERPYKRPPLSKGLWKGKPLEKIWRNADAPGVDVHLGRRIDVIDVKHKSVRDDKGDTHTFDKLLLATGGRPRQLPFADGRIIYFRTLEDYRRLRHLAEQYERFVAIGGGFIGSEIAAALAMNGKRVTIIFPESGIGARLFPRDLSDFLNDYYRDKGVEVLAGETVKGLDTKGDRTVVQTSGGREIAADGVVAGLGIEPNVDLARQAGLKVENGIIVDELLRTSHPDVFAAGDVASFHNPALDKRMRVEHEDNANTMGRWAGRNMTGEAKPYDYLPYFYSDLFDLGYEAVGEMDSRMEIFADWQEPFHKGVVYYLKEGRVRGALLWNVWDQVPAARELIASPGDLGPNNLKGRLPAEG